MIEWLTGRRIGGIIITVASGRRNAMRIYLDNCCFNRPYDNQTQLKIFLESQAKLQVQKDILSRKHELIWSFILDYENAQNPYHDRREAIREWEHVAATTILLSDSVLEYAQQLSHRGIKKKDAYHISCAVIAGCKAFLTTDKKLLNTPLEDIRIMNPIQFIIEMEEIHGHEQN